jgi:hypothetical protein
MATIKREERKARDPKELSVEELKKDSDKEMIEPKEMKKARKTNWVRGK